MERQRIASQRLECGAAQSPGRAIEVALEHLVVQTDRLEHLSAAIAGQGADAHLRHDLQETLLDGADVVADGSIGVFGFVALATCSHVPGSSYGEVGMDEGRPVADEAGVVMVLAWLARIAHDGGPGAPADEQQAM